MPEAVYRMLVLLCTLVTPLPIGTNLGRWNSALGRHTDVRRCPRVRPRARKLPAATHTGPPRGSHPLSYSAASSPAIPTGFWDRRPHPTQGRLRRALARRPIPQDVPRPARLRVKAALTAHLPTGF